MRIIAAWAEEYDGPGWSNQLIWYLVRRDNGRLELVPLQYNEQTVAMRTLFDVSAVISKQLKEEVEHAISMQKLQ